MFISPLRRYTALLVFVLLASLIGGVWYITNSKRICMMAEALLSAVLGGEAHVGDGHLSLAGTLELTDVHLKTPGPAGESLDLFSAEQVEMRFDWISLLTAQLRATQITAVKPTLYLIEDRATGRWNYERLQRAPGPEGGGAEHAMGQPTALITSLPFIVLRDAQVQWAEISSAGLMPTAKAVIDGGLTPNPAKPMVYDFQIDQRPESQGTGTSVSGQWDVPNNTFYAATTPIDLARLDLKSLPRQVRQWWQEHELSGRVASLRTTLDKEAGLSLFIDLQNVSMVQVLDERTAQKVPLAHVSGALEFNLTHATLEVRKLSGYVFGYAFRLDAEVGGFSPDAPFNFSVVLPNANVSRDYPELVNSFQVAYDVTQRLHPAGLMDLRFNIKRPRWNGHVFTRGTITCKDVQARLCHFPYPLDHVRGTIDVFDDRIEVSHMTAFADETFLSIEGTAGTVPENQSIDMTVQSDRATLDERMKLCMPPDLQATWATFSPHGVGKLLCRVTRPNRQHEAPKIDVTVEPEDVEACFSDFPYRLEHLHGKIMFSDARTEIAGLDGRCGLDGSGRVHLAGSVDYPQGGSKEVEPHVKVVAEDLPVDDALITALPPKYRRWLEAAELTGRIGLHGMIVNSAQHEMALEGNVVLSDGALKLKAISGLAFDHVSASVDLKPDIISVSRLVASPAGTPDAVIQLAATIKDVQNKTRISTEGQFTGLPLTPVPPPMLPALWSKRWAEYKPSGRVDGDFAMEGVAVGPGTTPAATTEPASAFVPEHYTLHVRPQGVSIAPAGWPVALTGIAGQIGMTPERIEITELSGQAGDVTLQAAGSYVAAADVLHLSLDAHAATLPAQWFVMLPGSFRTVLETIKPQAAWTLHLPTLERRSKGGTPLWSFAGNIALTDCKLQGPVATTIANLSIDGKGGYDVGKAGLDFIGEMQSDELTFANRTIDTLHAAIVAKATDKSILFNDVTGTVAGGTLHGNIGVHLEKDASYEASMVLGDADVATLALGKGNEEEKKKLGTGRLTATLNVQQQFGPNADRTGRGEMVVRDGNLFHVPLAMGLMQIVTLRMPVSGSFKNATMSYYLRDNKITFEKILFESPGINLAGLGTLSLADRQLDLNFVTESPHEITLPVIFDITQFIRDQILQIHVSGSVEKPNIQPVPLNALTTPIRDLLPKRKAAEK
jgi:hypothetical protein